MFGRRTANSGHVGGMRLLVTDDVTERVYVVHRLAFAMWTD